MNLMKIARGAAGEAGKMGRRLFKTTTGTVSALRNRGPKAGMDDVTLARKVETEIFRDAGAPKGKVDVNVAHGIVELRGEARTPTQKADLEARARRIPEVRDVNNLLHLPKTPAPTRADSPGRARRKSTTDTKPKTPRSGRARTTAERSTAKKAEPTPAERAEEGTGRTSAPLGSSSSS